MIVIDYRDKRPLYEQVTEKLAHLIICGALESNAKLPSVRSLAIDLSVNPNTVQRAYAQLEQEGYIYTVVGRGNYVTDSHEWREGKLLALEKELTENIVRAKEAGMAEDNILSLVSRLYHDESAISGSRPEPSDEKLLYEEGTTHD